MMGKHHQVCCAYSLGHARKSAASSVLGVAAAYLDVGVFKTRHYEILDVSSCAQVFNRCKSKDVTSQTKCYFIFDFTMGPYS